MEIIPIDRNIKCKICFEGEEFGELISPCGCDGSIKYVHRKCLNQWRFNNINLISRTKCEICERPYLIRQAFKMEKFIFNIIKTSNIKIFIYYLLYFLMIFTFSFLFYLMDIGNDYISLKIISFSDKKNENLLNILKNNDGIWLLYYISFTTYIYSFFFYLIMFISPFLMVNRKKLYFKNIYYKYLICLILSSHFHIFYPLFNNDNNINSTYIYIYLEMIFSMCNYSLSYMYIYLNDCTIKKMNTIYNDNIVLNCNYNPIYEGKEANGNVMNNMFELNNIFEPRRDGMINGTMNIIINQIPSPPRLRRQRVRPHPPPSPPPSPPTQ